MRGNGFGSGALLSNKNNKKPISVDAPIVALQLMGSINMADQTPRYRSYDTDVDIPDKTPIDRRVAPYRFGQSPRADFHPEEPVPLFLSDYDGEPDPSEYLAPLRARRRSLSTRILAGVLAAAAVAALFAMFSADVTHDIIVNAKASIAAALPAPYAAAKPDSAQLTALRWRRRVRRSQRLTRARCRAALRPLRHRLPHCRSLLRRSLPHRSLRRRQQEGSMPTNSPP